MVSSPSQCPSSDQCPPPPSGPGSVVQCSRKEGSEANSAQQDSESITPTTNESNSVFIFTDKQTYEKGQIVKITVQNNSRALQNRQPQGSCYKEFAIRRKIFTVYIIKIKNITSGSSMEFGWNQHDREGKQVSSGNYSSSVSVRSLRANTAFVIS